MSDARFLAAELAWPLGLLLAWMAGEIGARWLRLPRVSVYAILGFVLGPAQTGLLSGGSTQALLLLANVAFGLILFETGYRINLRWLRANPWIGWTCLVESMLAFAAVFAATRWYGMALSNALLIASLSMATSPAIVLRVINEQESAGQVSERALHLSALSSVLAVLLFKMIAGLLILRHSGNLWEASYHSALAACASVALGAVGGFAIPALLRRLGRTCSDVTLAFALAVIVLVSVTHALKLSPVLAALSFGVIARHRRIAMPHSERSFGPLGNILSVVMFVFIASTLEWRQVVAGLGLGSIIIVARQLAKTTGVCLFAHASGITLRKGMLLGLALTPLSAFVILVLEQTRHLGIAVLEHLAPLTAAALLLEILGPVATQRALIAAREVPEAKE